MALGELPVASKGKRVFQIFPIKHLILHVVPFPKGAPTAPELLAANAASVDAIRSELVSVVERIGAGPREADGPVHPLFGRLSFREWGIATYKHTDHHLRQFGAEGPTTSCDGRPRFRIDASWTIPTRRPRGPNCRAAQIMRTRCRWVA